MAEVPIDEEKSRSAAPGGAELPSSEIYIVTYIETYIHRDIHRDIYT